MTTFVALDLETTGLDSTTDEIIDIGAVRFTARRTEAEMTTLVRPRGHISAFITNLTGITDNMVQQAPSLDEVLPRLRDFIGDAVIVGHNIRFDLGFLEQAGLFLDNPVVDTYELASVLLPGASRYGLGALGHMLGIPLRATHRALDDARVNQHLYLKLAALAEDLPLDLVAKIVRLGVDAQWDGTWLFQQVLFRKQRAGEKPSPRPLYPHRPRPPSESSLPQPEATKPLSPDEVAAMLEPGGALAQHFPQFEHRPQQVTMARAVAQALSQPHHLIVEAGTGTGKSIAYLLPAARFALENNTRVVVSTNTKNLQDQLLQKDIPTVKAVVGERLRAAVLKGRANYLCPHRLEGFLEQKVRRPEEARVLAKVLVWLHQGGSGDRSEITLRGAAENAVWQRLSADAPACTAEACVRHTHGLCPLQQARQAAEQAHIVVVNHALLLSDVASGSRVLPEYNYLIVDEAHHLESATTQALSFTITQADLRRMFSELGSPRTGFLGRLLSAARKSDKTDYQRLAQHVETATTYAFLAEEALKAVFANLHEFLEDQREGRALGQYPQQVRITPAVRTLPYWDGVNAAWEEAAQAFSDLDTTLRQLRAAVLDMGLPAQDPKIQDVASEVENLRFRLSEAAAQIHALIAEPSEGMIYWVQMKPRSRGLSLHAAPLEVASQMQHHIWYAKSSVILTSATLTIGGDLEYLRSRLAAYDADELILGSPFDYKQAALLYVVNDIPEPNDRQRYQRAVEQGLIDLAIATRGRLMALFTSYAQLQRTARAIRPALLEAGLAVYEQGSGAAPQALLDEFRTSEGAVLLGTRAFWEGVDIPGEALSALVIVKLPFAVPSDPIVAARAETFEDPFHQYHLPEAILAFRQGFGRLIRTKTDRGLVAVFDRRLLSKRYGTLFLESLPPCTQHQGPMHRLPSVAARWLARGAEDEGLS